MSACKIILAVALVATFSVASAQQISGGEPLRLEPGMEAHRLGDTELRDEWLTDSEMTNRLKKDSAKPETDKVCACADTATKKPEDAKTKAEHTIIERDGKRYQVITITLPEESRAEAVATPAESTGCGQQDVAKPEESIESDPSEGEADEMSQADEEVVVTEKKKEDDTEQVAAREKAKEARGKPGKKIRAEKRRKRETKSKKISSQKNGQEKRKSPAKNNKNNAKNSKGKDRK